MRVISLIGALALVGCSADNALNQFPTDTGFDDADTDAEWDPGDDDPPPPEEEDDFLALRPSDTPVYVFVANPNRGTVTRVEVSTLEVRTAEVGNDPRVVLTTPDGTTAVVFNRADDAVTILDAQTLEGPTVQVRDDFNAMVMSPDGRFVALFHDVHAERADDPPPDGIRSFNEVSFVDVTTGEHFPMAVDVNPREIQFTPDATLATVVTDTSLGLVDLTAAVLIPEIVPLTDDLVDPPTAEEVEVTPDGAYAFVRQAGATDLAIVDLATSTVSRVAAGDDPSDLDLTPDGGKAVLVSRASHELRVFSTVDPFAEPQLLALPPDEPLGSVVLDPTGKLAIVYTTASPIARYATWDLQTDEITLRQLVKPVRSMAITPTGASLLVIHTRSDSDDTDPAFIGHSAITLVSLTNLRQTNPLLLPAEPIGWVNSSDGRSGYFIMEGEPYLERLDYATLLPYEIRLHSDPVYVGVLPDLNPNDADEPYAWSSEDHPLGRMSFFDPNADQVRTITGFELNSEVED